MKIGGSGHLVAPIKHMKSICPYIFSFLCCEGGQVENRHPQEEMYYEILSNSPEINYTLYIVHKENLMAYLDPQKTLHFMENQKLPVQNLVNKEIHFVKAIVNRIL